MGKLTRAQEKAIFAKLKQKGFRQKPKKIRLEGSFIRARIESPKKYQKGSFRNIPAGKDTPMGTRLIVARPKGKVITKTQAILVPKAVFFDGKRYRKR